MIYSLAMSCNRELDELYWANKDVYGTPNLIKQYMQYPYQQMRCEIAVKLLNRALSSSDTPAGGLLELGAGSQGIVNTTTLANDGRKIIYADIEPSPIIAFRENQQSKNCSFLFLDASKQLPFKDASLAAIMAGELIEHLFDQLHY